MYTGSISPYDEKEIESLKEFIENPVIPEEELVATFKYLETENHEIMNGQ